MTFPDFFWIGPQKAASTWAYRCFREHPEIYVHEDENLSGIGGDALHYFDMHYGKGHSWYQQFFEDYEHETVAGDTTPSYIRSPMAPRRMANDVPEAKLIACLRNPIDRAFSHYWHEKKKQKITFEFQEILENYDLFQNWLEPGFYYEQISTYLEYFDREQMLFMFMADLKEDEQNFISTVFHFLDVDAGFEPSVLDERVNQAGHKRDIKAKIFREIAQICSRLGVKKYFTQDDNYAIKKRITNFFLNKTEYEQGMAPGVRNELIELMTPDVRKLEQLVQRDLSHWIERSGKT